MVQDSTPVELRRWEQMIQINNYDILRSADGLSNMIETVITTVQRIHGDAFFRVSGD